MKIVDKSTRLENAHYEIRGPILEEAMRMEAAGEKILKLNIGNPAAFGFDSPPEIRKALAESLLRAQGYSQSKGITDAREAIADYCAYKGMKNVGVGDIFTGNGVSELILMAMQAFLEPGDEVLLPAPDYPLWTAAVSLNGGVPVHYRCDEQAGWFPDVADMRKKVTSRTRAIVIINPNNPTGVLYPREVLEDVAAVAREFDLTVFADEIYDRLLMDGQKHTAFAAVAPDLFVVSMNGLSKSHLATGFRSGWMCMCGEKAHAKGYVEGVNTLASMRLCSNVPAQHIIPLALADRDRPDPLYLPGGKVYERREAICKALEEVDGITAVRPNAAFYVFPRIDIKRFNTTDRDFCFGLLREKKILVVSGSGFNWEQPDHFRIVYLPEPDELRSAARGISEYLSGLESK